MSGTSPTTEHQLPARLRLRTDEGRPIAAWGMVFLVATEGMLFGLLLFVYFYLWSITTPWPPTGVEPPELVVSGIRTGLLLGSSLTLWAAERAFAAGRRRGAALGLGATLLLAIVFLAGHVEEMIKIIPEFTWDDSAYGSIYYTIVNFHAAHLLVGVGLLTFALVRLGRGAYSRQHDTQLRTASLYWHFVDVIWAIVYTSLYIAPNL